MHYSSYSFILILLNFNNSLDHALKMCMWFESGAYNPIISPQERLYAPGLNIIFRLIFITFLSTVFECPFFQTFTLIK